MNPRVKEVSPEAEYVLRLVFTNGEVRLFDVKPYLDRGIFRELQESSFFKAVRAVMGSVRWPNGQDFCPDTLYMESRSVPGRAGSSVGRRVLRRQRLHGVAAKREMGPGQRGIHRRR